MKLEICKPRTQAGTHIGELAGSLSMQAELRRMHALGYNTIWASDYEMLVSAGFEPHQFLKAWPIDERTLDRLLKKRELESLV